MSDTLERIARALCRYTWESGKNLDAYVEIHWKDHVPAAGVALAAQRAPDDLAGMAWWNGLSDADRKKWAQPSGRAKDAWDVYRRGEAGTELEEKIAELIREHCGIGYAFKDGHIDSDTLHLAPYGAATMIANVLAAGAREATIKKCANVALGVPIYVDVDGDDPDEQRSASDIRHDIVEAILRLEQSVRTTKDV